MALSATRVRALKDPGRYSDGGGLHLYISRAGSKSWVLRITIDGHRRDIGLGGYPAVSLARAREKAVEIRAAVAAGRDPLADRSRPPVPTFREAARAVHEANSPRWRNGRHIAELAADPGAPRHACPGQHTRRPDRSGRRAGSPHADMDQPAGDGPAGASAYAGPSSGGRWRTASLRPIRQAKLSTVRCPQCRR